MPLDSQFSLSLELTKLVPFGPLATAAGRGVLQLARNLKKTGSDIVVEEDLANIFGRNRIEPQFESTFRTVVKESSVKQLGVLVDIVLHDGAGPTVHRSLSDRRYFSTVVQLSLLTSNLNLWSLSTGLSHALARRVEGAPLDQRDFPTVDSLMGTLRACREQTSAFRWNLLFEAVDNVLSNSKLISPRTWLFGFGASVPSTILQGCLDFFTSAQHFPDDRIIRVRLSNGENFLCCLLIVWAHHVLGMTVHVTNHDGSISLNFGAGKESLILIVNGNYSSPESGDICLLEKSRDEVFRIVADNLAPEISSDHRVPARGYAATWIADNIAEGDRECLKPSTCLRYSVSLCMKSLESYGHSDFRSRTLSAAKLLFGELYHQSQLNDLPLEHLNLEQTCHLQPLANLLRGIACVEDLDVVEDFPISFGILDGFYSDSSNDYRDAFLFMSSALLGADLHKFDVKSTSLISHCGWSIFSNIIGLPDPLNTSRGLIRVQRGVPTRGGEQKRSIRGVSERAVKRHFNSGPPPELPLTLNAYHVDHPTWYVGLTENAFEVGLLLETKVDGVQDTDQDMKLDERKMAWKPYYSHFTGFKSLENLGNHVQRLAPCSHKGSALRSSYDLRPGCAVSGFPLSLDYYYSKEGVVCKVTRDVPIVIFASAGNRWARWSALLYVSRLGEERAERASYIRPHNCCPDCAMRTVKEKLEIEPDASGGDPKLAYIIL